MLNLHELYLKSFSWQTQPEERQLVTDALLNFYNDPQSTLSILDFLTKEQDVNIRHAASIGLKRTIKNNWKSQLVNSQFRDMILAALINILQNETVSIIRHCLVQGMVPIFKTEANRWPQLFELVTNLTSDTSRLDAFEFAMYLISYFAPSLAPASVSDNINFFISLCNFAFNTNDIDLIDTSCGLVAVLIRVVDDDNDLLALGPVFEKMIEIYSNSLSGNEDYANRIASKVSFAFICDRYPFPNDAILSKLFEAVPKNPIIAFGPISQFIECSGKKLAHVLPNIIQQTLSIAGSLFVDAPLEGNTDSMYVLYAIEAAASTMKKRATFEKLLELISTNTPQESIVSAMAISRVMHVSSEAVTKNLSTLSQFFLNILKIPHICAKEVAADSIKEIAQLLEEGKSSIANQFIPPLLELLDCEEPSLVKHTLSALCKLFSCCDIDSSMIGIALQKLCNLLQPNSPARSSDVFDTLSSLVFSSGEDVAPYTSTLFPLILQTASLPEENDPTLKANAIESLSNILRFSTLDSNSVNNAISLIVTSGQTNDFDVRSSVMIALSNLLAVNIPQILNFNGPIQKLVSVYINEEIEADPQAQEDDEFEDEDDGEIERALTGNQNQINSLTNTLLLIKNIYKLQPQLGPSNPEEWMTFCINCMNSISDDLSVAATLAALYILFRVQIIPDQFFQALQENFESDSCIIVGSCFKVISRFLENNISISEDVIKFTVEKGGKALVSKLPCQNEEFIASDNDTLTLSMQVNRFFSVLATKIPSIFPINEFIDHKKYVDGEFEMSQYIGVLRQYYLNFGPQIQLLKKKVIIKTFFTNLNICDFNVIPEPLIAIRNVLEREPNLIERYMNDLITFIQTLFQQEDEGQVHFWATITNAISLLCSLIKINPSNFDYALWLPHILSHLPVQGDEMEAEHIYSTLLFLIQNNQNILSQYPKEFLRIFAQTLGLKDKVFSSFHLSNETILGIIQTFMQLMQTPGSDEVFTSSLPDQLSQERCKQRVANISQ